MKLVCGDWSASCAIRCCFGDTVLEFRGIRRISHQRVHDPASRFSPPGPGGVPFPGFDDTIRTLRLPAARLAALRCLRLAIPSVTSRVSLPPARNVQTGGPGRLRLRCSPRPRSSVETTGSPKFLGNPHCLFALVFDSGRTNRLRPIRDECMAPAYYRTKAPALSFSKLHSRASELAVYASSDGLPHRNARLASRCGSGSPGRA